MLQLNGLSVPDMHQKMVGKPQKYGLLNMDDRLTHNLKVVGSNPTPATTET